MDKNNLWQLVHGTNDHTAECSADDIERNKLICILCYISILWLVPLFLRRDSRYAKFHVNQGIILSILGVVFAVASWLLGNIPVISIVFYVTDAITLAYAILGIYNTITGKAKELPFIGGYSIIK